MTHAEVIKDVHRMHDLLGIKTEVTRLDTFIDIILRRICKKNRRKIRKVECAVLLHIQKKAKHKWQSVVKKKRIMLDKIRRANKRKFEMLYGYMPNTVLEEIKLMPGSEPNIKIIRKLIPEGKWVKISEEKIPVLGMGPRITSTSSYARTPSRDIHYRWKGG